MKSLATNADRALPALKKARATADDDLRWWIDAVIELIEADPRGKTSAND